MPGADGTFLLSQIAAAPGQRLGRGEANKQIPAAARRALGLTSETADRLREELCRAGLLAAQRTGRKQEFSVTDLGREYLERNRAGLPSFASRSGAGFIPPSND